MFFYFTVPHKGSISDYFAGQIENYCSSIGETVSDWWDGLGEDQVTVDANNRLILRAPAYAAVQSAVGWWRDQNAVQSGSSAVSVFNGGLSVPLTSPEGTTIKIGSYNSLFLPGSSTKFFLSNFTQSADDNSFAFGNSFYINFIIDPDLKHYSYSLGYISSLGGPLANSSGYSSSAGVDYLYLLCDSDRIYICSGAGSSFQYRNSFSVNFSKTFLDAVVESSLSVSQPKTYTELEVPADAPGVALDLGLTAAADVDAALQQILEKLTANELAGTQTVAGSGEGEGEDEESPYLPYIPHIFQKLEALPDTISDKIHDLFVPSDEFIEALPAQFANVFESRCGLLTYPASLLVDFFTRLSTLTAQEPVFSWGNIYEPFSNTLLIPSGSYNLNSSVQNEAMQRVYSVYLIVVKALVALWFVDLCRRKYNQIIYK